MPWRLIALVLVGWALSACGQGGPTAVDAVQNYVSSVAEGSFGSACAELDHHAQAMLVSVMRSSQSCAVLLARCFPSQATNVGKDQTQLLYATVQLNLHGSRGEALTGGTTVAKAVKEVTVIDRKGKWKLDSYGKERCARRAPRR